VAQSASVDVVLLSGYQCVSEGRDLRVDDPDPPLCRINWCQYCRRLWKAGNGEFRRFLNIASGSASELEYHFLLARDLAFLSDLDYRKLNDAVVEVKRMLASLSSKVEAERLAG